MKVLKVIHGFPPDYMAGSEVYSYQLVKALSKMTPQISVFSRAENEFDEPYKIYDEVYDGITIQRVNRPDRDYSYESKFHNKKLEEIFREYLIKIKPDVVHFGHLSHLSTNLVNIVAEEHKLPVIYTVHDFWLFCVKGQLINQNNEICKGPSPTKCHDCSPYQTTIKSVREKLNHMKKVMSLIDIFLVPSHTLRKFFIDQGVPKNKVIYSKYGFNVNNIEYKKRTYTSKSQIKFGFMGRIIPSKGIRVLIDAFQNTSANLFIYGHIGNKKRFLENSNIHFQGGYDNNNINQVLNDIDVLIVPSIWLENSPLVIQEAFLAGIPVITSNIGGMSELVKNEVNGYLFEVGDEKSLQELVTTINSNPTMLNNLSVSRAEVRTIEDDADFVYSTYKTVTRM